MENPKLTSQTAEAIVNLLRDNPGVAMTLDQIEDELGDTEELDIAVEDLGAYLEELVVHNHVERETTEDGFDTFRFPAQFQRSTGAP